MPLECKDKKEVEDMASAMSKLRLAILGGREVLLRILREKGDYSEEAPDMRAAYNKMAEAAGAIEVVETHLKNLL